MSYLEKLNELNKSMQSPPSFLGVYCDLANGIVNRGELNDLYSYLKKSLATDTLAKWFQKDIDITDQVIAVDAVAHEIQNGRSDLYKDLFNRDPSEAVEVLNDFDGLEATEEWRRVSRDYFADLGDCDIEVITKGEELDSDVMAEAQKLAKHFKVDPDLVTTAQKISLQRLNLIETDESLKEPLILGGWASIEMIDKEGHLITSKALRKSFRRFMKNPLTRNVQILHSDIQAGWVLPFYVLSDRTVKKSEVSKRGLYIVCEIRSDLSIIDKVKKEIEEGTIRSFSIAGTAKDKVLKTKAGRVYYEINDLQLAEISLCEVPVNPDAHFTILKSK